MAFLDENGDRQPRRSTIPTFRRGLRLPLGFAKALAQGAVARFSLKRLWNIMKPL